MLQAATRRRLAAHARGAGFARRSNKNLAGAMGVNDLLGNAKPLPGMPPSNQAMSSMSTGQPPAGNPNPAGDFAFATSPGQPAGAGAVGANLLNRTCRCRRSGRSSRDNGTELTSPEKVGSA